MGSNPFKIMIQDTRFTDAPMILETPGEFGEDKKNLNIFCNFEMEHS